MIPAIPIAGQRAVVTPKSIPLDKYPGLIVTLCFDKPDILFDIEPAKDELTGGVALGTLPSFGVHLKEHWDQGSVTLAPHRNDTTSTTLGRMLAKIGHSFAIAELGIDGFRPFLQPIILGEDVELLSYYVGGSRAIPKSSTNVYEINLVDVTSRLLLRPYHMVSIRLLADVQGMPEYFVVVGEPL